MARLAQYLPSPSAIMTYSDVRSFAENDRQPMTSYLPSVVTLALSRLFFYRHYDINGRKFIDIEDIGLFVTSGSHVATLTGGLDFQKGRNHVFRVGVQFLGLGYCTEENTDGTQFRVLQSVT